MIEQRMMRRPRRWLELASTVIALFISVVSLWVAVRSTDANNRMVAAASWPYLQIKSGNSSGGQMMNLINLRVENAGVGPAKIQTFEVFWHGRAYPTARSLMEACCKLGPEETTDLGTSPPVGVLRAGDSVGFLSYARTPKDDATWKAFDRARLTQLTYRACYCSVFDECRVSDLMGRETAVKACPKPAIAYQE